MKNNLIVLERLFDVPTKRVWKALTDSNELKNWYFDLNGFKAEVGYQFQFTGGHDKGIQYLHLCEITEVVPNEKLTYSWRYDGHSGVSYVTFELFDLGSKTLLKLTHSDIETFPKDNPDFAIHNFEEGWNIIINSSLKNHLENDNFQHEITVSATIEKVYKSISNEIPLWWTEMFEGASSKLGEIFTVRFGSSVFKTMRVEELIPNKRISWLVTDTLIDIPELKNKREWLNTTIIWEFKEDNTRTIIRVTHIGLNSTIECYGICTTGWRQFCDSLKLYLETGNGTPFKEQTRSRVEALNYQLIKKRNARVINVTPEFKIIEYGHLGNGITNGTVAEINGRYPQSGWGVNKVSDELVYVISGNGTLEMPEKLEILSEGDVAFIPKGQQIAWNGRKLKVFIPCIPAWTREQHELIK